MHRRKIFSALVLVGLLALIAVPVLAGGQGKENGQGQSKEKVAEAPITITGTIEVGTDEDGNDAYTVRDGGTTYTLDAGPSWFFGKDHPLKPFVGQSVTIDGGGQHRDRGARRQWHRPARARQAALGRWLEGRGRASSGLVPGEGGPVQREVRRLLPARALQREAGEGARRRRAAGVAPARSRRPMSILVGGRVAEWQTRRP